MSVAHEIDYKIYGHDMKFIEIELDPGETVIAEAGAMMYMDEKIQMETIFGDGSGRDEGQGFMGKLLGAGKRALAGEGLFMTAYTNVRDGKAKAAFAAPYPGGIVPMDLTEYQGEIICQKDAFLCAAKGVSVSICFQKKLGAGFFGGEGFIMEKLEGDGLAFLHAGGTIVKKKIVPGQMVKIDTGCLVAMTKDIDFDVQMQSGIKNAFFGGEGMFLGTLSGSGYVWLQSLPFSRMANKIYSAVGSSKGETSGMTAGFSDLGGLGDLLNFN